MGGLRDTPLGAFVELRLRLAWRRLRGSGGVPELVAKAITWLMLVPLGLLFAAFVGAGTWRAARAGHGLQAELPVMAILYGIWQAWTAVALSFNDREDVDLRRFLAYPLPPARIFAYGLASSILGDPFSVFWCLLLGGAWAGAALGRPGAWLLPLAVALGLFALATAVLVLLLQEALGRLLRGRRLRGVLVALVYVGLAFVSATLASTRRPPDLQALGAVLGIVKWIPWPAALAAAAARRLFAGDVLAALPYLAGLAAATALAGWAAYRLALGAARSGGGAPAARGAAGGAGWPLDRLPGRLGPLLEREVKHLLRHPLPGVLLLVIPAMAGFISWKVVPLIPQEAGEVLRALPLLGFALYTHLAAQPLTLNAFGWDRGGARLAWLAPFDLAELLLAKNGASYALAAVLYLGSAALSVALGGAPPAWALLGAVALHAGLAPWLLGLGNLVSILNPRAAPLALQRGGQLPVLSGLLGMAIVSGVAGIFGLPVLLAVRLDQPWVLPVAWAVLGLLGLAGYRVSLPRVAALLSARREPLLAAVTGDDG